MASNPEPLRKKQHIIKDLKQLQVLADPLRLRLLELLSQKAMTVTQVANVLGEKPNRIYYHINKLEQVGLVQLVETRPYRGILEKYYRAVAEGFRTDDSLLQLQETTVGSLYELVRSAFESTLDELRQTLKIKLQEAPGASIEPGRQHAEFAHFRLRHGKEKEVYNKIIALCKEIGAIAEPDGDEEYSFTLLFYPVARPAEKSPEEEKGT